MARSSNNAPRIFFPWEARVGMRRWSLIGRVRPALAVLAMIGLVVSIAYRERKASGQRRTRATLLDVRHAVEASMADHDGGCPPSMEEVARLRGTQGLPLDAWGHPLELICPSPIEGNSYDLRSAGPDGIPGGLDRLE